MNKKNDAEMWDILEELYKKFPYPEKIKKGKSKPGSTILLRAYKDEVEGRNDINQIGPGRRTLDTKIKEWEKEKFNLDEILKNKPQLRIYYNTITSLINCFFNGNFEPRPEFADKHELFAIEYTFYGFNDPDGEKVSLFAQMFIVIEIIRRSEEQNLSHINFDPEKDLTDINMYFMCKPWLDKGKLYKNLFLKNIDEENNIGEIIKNKFLFREEIPKSEKKRKTRELTWLLDHEVSNEGDLEIILDYMNIFSNIHREIMHAIINTNERQILGVSNPNSNKAKSAIDKTLEKINQNMVWKKNKNDKFNLHLPLMNIKQNFDVESIKDNAFYQFNFIKYEPQNLVFYFGDIYYDENKLSFGTSNSFSEDEKENKISSHEESQKLWWAEKFMISRSPNNQKYSREFHIHEIETVMISFYKYIWKELRVPWSDVYIHDDKPGFIFLNNLTNTVHDFILNTFVLQEDNFRVMDEKKQINIENTDMAFWIGFFQRLLNTGMKSYEDAKQYAKSLNLNSPSEWYKLGSVENNHPRDIPINPHKFYRDAGSWVSWNDFLGIDSSQTV